MVMVGVGAALLSLVLWGLGDFLIQRSVRHVGNIRTLFYVGIGPAVLLLPFVWQQFPSLYGRDILLLCLLSVVVMAASLFDFQALRQGKIAVVEPVIGLELPLIVAFSVTLGRETIAPHDWIIMSAIFVGILFAVTRERVHWHMRRHIFERGVHLALLGAIGLALTNFLVGVSSRETSPLMAIWFSSTFYALCAVLYLCATKRMTGLLHNLVRYPVLAVTSVVDATAWIAYGYAVLFLPIAIAASISESYLAVAVLLGVYFNKERIKPHQKVGALVAILGVIALAYSVGAE